MILAIGGMLLAVATAEADSGFGAVHGNWCGAGNRVGQGGEVLPPVDLLDTACMRHDFCIAWHGAGDCGCDGYFLYELRHLPYPDPHQATKARAIYDAMSWLPCAGPAAVTKPLWFFGQLVEDLHSGGPPPWDVVRRLFYALEHPW